MIPVTEGNIFCDKAEKAYKIKCDLQRDKVKILY